MARTALDVKNDKYVVVLQSNDIEKLLAQNYALIEMQQVRLFALFPSHTTKQVQQVSVAAM